MLNTPHPTAGALPSALRHALAALLLAGGAVAALVPAPAQAQSAPAAPEAAASAPAPMPGARRAAHPHGGPGMHRPGHPMPGGMVGGMPMHGPQLERLLERVNATPEQRAQIRQIHEAERADLRAEHEAARALHEEGARLFTAERIDIAAAEALRQKMLAHHDKVSHRHLQAMIDIANVLTPAQRRDLAALMADAPGRRMPAPPAR